VRVCEDLSEENLKSSYLKIQNTILQWDNILQELFYLLISNLRASSLLSSLMGVNLAVGKF
jgi:hypothetical protein